MCDDDWHSTGPVNISLDISFVFVQPKVPSAVARALCRCVCFFNARPDMRAVQHSATNGVLQDAVARAVLYNTIWRAAPATRALPEYVRLLFKELGYDVRSRACYTVYPGGKRWDFS